MSVKSFPYINISFMSQQTLVELINLLNPTTIKFTAILCHKRYSWSYNVSEIIRLVLQQFHI